MLELEQALSELEREIRTLHFWWMLRHASDNDFAVYTSKLARNNRGPY